MPDLMLTILINLFDQKRVMKMRIDLPICNAGNPKKTFASPRVTDIASALSNDVLDRQIIVREHGRDMLRIVRSDFNICRSLQN
jgi:hypothetical protein